MSDVKPTTGRYEPRISDKGWVVWDTKRGSPIATFTGDFNNREAVAQAARLNRAYAEVARIPRRASGLSFSVN